MLGKEEEDRLLKIAKTDFEEAKKAKVNVWNYISTNRDKIDISKKQHKKGSSKLELNEVQKKIEAIVPVIREAFRINGVVIKVGGREDIKVAIKRYVKTALSSNVEMQELAEDIARVTVEDGTSWVKTGWKRAYRNKSYLNEDGEKETRRTLIQNHGTVELLSNANVYTDPNAKKDSDMTFFIIRKMASYADLVGRKEYKQSTVEKLKGEVEEATDSYENIDDINRNLEWGKSQDFSLADKEQKQHAVIEYWGYTLDEDNNKIVTLISWVEGSGKLLRVSHEPTMLDRLPFHSITYSRRVGSLWGRGLADFIGGLVDVKTGLIRGILDALHNSNNGQKFVNKKDISYAQLKRLEAGAPIIYMNNVDGIKFASYGTTPSSVFNIIDLVDTEMEQFEGGNLKQQISSEGANQPSKLTLGQLKTSILADKIAGVFARVAKDWLDTAHYALTDRQLAILFDNIDDIQFNAFDPMLQHVVQIKVKTGAVVFKEAREINLTLQNSATIAERVPPKAYSNLLARMYDNMDMPQTADLTRNYEPKPSPMEMKMQELKMAEQNAKVNLETQRLENEKWLAQSRSVDSQAKATKATADARLAEAKALESEAKSQSLRLDSALKPLSAMNELEKSQAEGDTRGKENK